VFTTLAGVDAGKLRAAFAAAFSEEPGDRPSTAAAFVASFQDAFSIRRESDEPAPSPVMAAVPVLSEEAVPVVSEEQENPSSEPVLEESDGAAPAPPRQEPVVGESRAARRRRARARRRERQATSEPIVPQTPPTPEPQERQSQASEPQTRTPQIRLAPPEPIRHIDIDAELVEDVAPGRALERVAPQRARAISDASYANPIQSGSRVFLVAAVVVVSFSAGFGGGFVAGHFSRPSTDATEVSQHEPVTPPQPARAAVEAPQPAAPTTTKTTAPVPEEKVSSSEKTGRLLVRSTPPGAAVVLDGQKRGITPLALGELAFGAHKIEISHPGHGTRQQRVTLSERRPERSVDVRLRPTSVPVPTQATAATNSTGSLQVSSRPSGAQVFVDDNLIGTTPFVVSDVAAGSRRLRIELSGYKIWTTSVQIEPSARFRVSASLEQ
jgi:hypothetical protein